MFNVKIRSQALLIGSFLETAANPMFRHSLYHEVLYRYHVLGETTLPNPGFPPYYDETFFFTIKHYFETSPLNINVMTTMQWYRVLLEDQVLKSPANESSPSTLIPCRVERLHPATDWPTTWSLARTRGLGSELTTFIFRLLHQLLPTKDRVSKFGLNTPAENFSN